MCVIGNLSNAVTGLSTPITELHVYDSDNVLLKDIDVTNTPLRYNNFGYIIRINGSVSNGMVSTSSQVIEFDTHNNSEKIEKIKLFTALMNVLS